MIAYNKEWLYNMHVRRQADDALQDACISTETHERIYAARPLGFYKVGFWGSIGLGLVTWLIIGAVTGLLAISFSARDSFYGLSIFVGVACYGIAEWIIYDRKHYNSGIDNILTWSAAMFIQLGIITALSPDENITSEITASLVVLVISGIMALRFADQLLSCVAFGGLLSLIYFLWQKTGPSHLSTAPFIMIIVSASVYFISARHLRSYKLLYYRYCVQCINVMALITLYAAGNYYVVMEMLGEQSYYRDHTVMPDSMGAFCWVWTFAIPIVYIATGIKLRNITHIRVGAILLVAGVLTFRYYHSVMSKEAALIVAGIILTVVSYVLIKRLNSPKGGFTFQSRGGADVVSAKVTENIISRELHQL